MHWDKVCYLLRNRVLGVWKVTTFNLALLVSDSRDLERNKDIFGGKL